MGTPLRLLIVEDSEPDAAMIVRRLQKEGYSPLSLRVETAEAMRAALKEQTWDLVVADYALPNLNGFQALEVLKQTGLDLPFILVSGAIGDDTAVVAMKAGAHDYLSKSNLARLGPAVRRELYDAEVRRERRRTAEGLRFLADASAALAESLDYAETLARVARLSVPFLAESCAVHVVERPQKIRWVAAAHVDPASDGALRERWARHPIEWDSWDPIAVALRTGEPRFILRAGDAALGVCPGGDDCGADVWASGGQAAMIVPLVARQKSLGTISLFSAGEARAYGPVDLALAQDLARRSAIAVDNARLYQEAREAIYARDTFLVCAAHELKTPLTRLKLHLDIARREAQRGQSGDLADRTARKLDIADGQVAALTKLVDDMLRVSRLGAADRALALRHVDLTALARDAAAWLQSELEVAGCKLIFHGEGPVVGTWDPSLLEAAIMNLLRNASKYGAKKPIEVVVEGDDDAARLVVKDHGIGIAPEDQRRIFERFERAVSANHYSGLGLGLWIAQEAVRALDGAIRVQSAPGEGATFTMELPRRGPAGQQVEVSA